MNGEIVYFRRAERDEKLAAFTEQWRKDGMTVLIDRDVPIVPLIRALNAGGFTVSNSRDGRLVIRCMPEGAA